MNNVQNPIFISSYYPKTPSAPQNDTAQSVSQTTPIWKNIALHNITIVNCPNSLLIWGLPEMPVDSVQLVHINISSNNGMQIYNAQNISFQNCSIQIKNGAEVKTYHAEVNGL